MLELCLNYAQVNHVHYACWQVRVACYSCPAMAMYACSSVPSQLRIHALYTIVNSLTGACWWWVCSSTAASAVCMQASNAVGCDASLPDNNADAMVVQDHARWLAL